MSDYEAPRVTLLGVVSGPLEPNASGENFFFACTAIEHPGDRPCGAMSPHTTDVRELRELALKGGWRLSGSEEPELFNGEALCPKHRRCSIADVLKRHAVPRGE
jgi:hypothetical protein